MYENSSFNHSDALLIFSLVPLGLFGGLEIIATPAAATTITTNAATTITANAATNVTTTHTNDTAVLSRRLFGGVLASPAPAIYKELPRDPDVHDTSILRAPNHRTKGLLGYGCPLEFPKTHRAAQHLNHQSLNWRLIDSALLPTAPILPRFLPSHTTPDLPVVPVHFLRHGRRGSSLATHR